MQQLKTLTVIILLSLMFSTFSGPIAFVQACDPASRLAFSAGAPQTLQAGTVSNQITIQLRDSSNNPVSALSDTTVNLATNASSSGHFYSDKNGKNPISTITINCGENCANFYYNDTLAGHPTLTASSGTLTPASTTFTINACSATKLFFSAGGNQTLNAGSFSNPIVVQRQDQYGNPTKIGGSITISLTTNSSNGTFYGDTSGKSSITSININALVSDSVGFYYVNTVAGHPTLTAASTGLTPVTTIFNITSAAGGATHFVVSAPSSAIAGVSFSVSVTAQDQYGNIVVGYSGVVVFSSSDVLAVLPGNSGLTAGVGSFSVTLKTVGSQTVTATDSVSGSITGTSNVVLVSAGGSGSVTHFSVVASPTSVVAGGSVGVTVKALDGFGNVVSAYSGVVVFSSSDVLAVLPGNSGLTAGVGSFSVTLKTVGSQTVTATDSVSGSITGTSNVVLVSAGGSGSVTHFSVVASPTSVVAGGSVGVTVKALDGFGNVVSAYSGVVVFSSSDVLAVLPGNSGLTAGVGSFSVTLKTVGSQTVTATDSVSGSITGTSNVVLVSAGGSGSVTHFSVVASPTSVVAGGSVGVTVKALDGFGNVVSAYSGVVVFSSSDVLAVLPGNSGLTAGVGSFSVTLKTVGSQTVTATDSVSGSITGTSNVVLVSAGGSGSVTHFSVVASPTSVVAGGSVGVTVKALDGFGNVVSAYSGVVVFSSSDVLAVLPGNSGLTAGVGSFSVTLKTVGSQTVTATDSVSGSITGTSNVVLVSAGGSGSVTHFSVVASPTSVVAGGSVGVTVKALDGFGNVVSAYSGVVVFSSSDVLAVLPGNSGLTAGVGSFSVTLKTVGSQTVTATDSVSGSITGTSNVVLVSAGGSGSVTHFSVVASPTSVVAGGSVGVTVKALDGFGNVVSAYSGVVVFSSSDVLAVLPGNSGLTAGVGSFSVTLKTVGSQTVTATDSVSGSITGTSNVVLVSAGGSGSVTHFSVVASPTSVVAGGSVGVTVKALDGFGNVVSAYSGVVVFSSSDVLAVLPGNSGLTAGVGSFSVTLKTVGSQTVTATDSVSGSITGTSNVVLVSAGGSGSVTHFSVVASPTSVVAGGSVGVTVKALDGFGNVVSAYSGVVVFSSSDVLAVLPGNSGLTAGVGSFSVTLKTVGSQTVTATDSVSGSITGTSNVVLVSAGGSGSVTHFSVVASPTSVVAGGSVGVTVKALDGFGNVVSAYSGVVVFSSSDVLAVLPGNSGLTAGVGSFSVTLKTVGSQTVTATDSVSGSITGTSNVVLVSAGGSGSVTHFSVVASPTSVVAGGSVGVTVKALDGFGNVVSAYSGVVVFSSSDVLAVLPGNSGLTAGVGSFSVTLKTVGSQTVTATDSVSGSITGTSNVVLVSAGGSGSVTHFSVVASPTSVVAGGSVGVTVKALDGFGNVVSAYSGVVVFSSSDVLAVLPGNSGLTAGVGSFSVTLKTVGSQTVTATDSVSGSITGTSNVVLVSAGGSGSVTHFSVVASPTSVVAGGSVGVTVKALDGFGNVVSAYSGVVVFSSSDVLAVLPGNSGLTAGVGSFSVTLKTVGSQTVTATDSVSGSITGTSNVVLVSAGGSGSVTHFSVVASPTSVVAGGSVGVTVKALDGFGNVVSAYSGVVVFSSSDVLAVLPGNSGLTAGVGSFSVTLKTVGSQTVTATDSVSGSITGTSNVVLVSAGGSGSVTHFSVVASPTSVVAGGSVGVTVKALDGFGNVVSAYSGVVVFSSSDVLAVLPGNSGLTAGVGSFSVTLKTVGSQTVTATDSVSGSITGTSNVVLVSAGGSGSVTHFSVVASPTSVVAGGSVGVTVKALDGFGNVVSAYSGVVVFSSSDVLAVLPGNSGLTAGVGSFSVTLKTVGSQTVTATDSVSGSITGTSNVVLVSAGGSGSVTHFSVVASPTSVVAGGSVGVTVKALDGFGNVVSAYSGVVVFSSSDVLAVLPGNSGLTAGVGSFSVTLKTVGSQTVTATDSVSGSITGTSNVVLVSAGGSGSVTHFSVVASPTSVVAGGSVGVTVKALDGFGNVVSAYSGVVVFSSSDVLAVLPGNSGLTAGVGSFSVTLKTVGSQTVTATDSVSGSITGTSNVVLVSAGGSGSVTHFSVVASPTSVVAGGSVGVTVKALDGFGNVVSAYSGVVVFSSSDVLAVLPGNSGLTAGVGSFSVTLKTVGSQTVTATDSVSGSITGTSNVVLVSAGGSGSVTHFSVVASPTSVVAGGSVGVTVKALDGFGNVVSAYSGVVVFSSSDVLAVLPGNSGLTAGVGSFSVTLKTVGSQTVTATDSVSGSITGTSNVVLVSAGGSGSVTHFSVVASPTSVVAGGSVGVTVKALDGFGNVVSAYSGVVVFSSSDVLAVLPGNSGLTAGVGSFSVTLKTVGSQTVTATDSVSGSITGTSNVVLVSAGGSGSVTHFSVVASPTSVVAGGSVGVTVKALDGFGNVVSAYSGVVVFSSSDVLAVLPGNSGLTAGVGSFSVTLKTVGSQTVTATDSVSGSITGTSNVVLVSAGGSGSVTHFSVVASPTSVVAGGSVGVTVKALDGFGNVVSAYSGVVVFSSSDVLAVLPGNSGLTAGVGSFSVTLKTVGSQTVTATDSVSGSITGTSNVVLVSAGGSGSVTHFSVVASPTSVVAGGSVGVTVKALDGFGNVVSAYSGVVVFSSSDVLAVLPGNSGLTAGVGSFSVTLKTVGSQTVTATDSVSGSITGTSNVVLVSAGGSGSVTHFSVVASPTSVVAGGSVGVTVKALDGFGNVVSAYSGVVVFSSSDVLAVLPGNSGLTAGVGSFSVTLKTVGSQTVTATDSVSGSITGTSNVVLVSAGGSGSVTHFSVVASPTSVVAGGSVGVTVKALDGFGNVVSAYSGVVVFSSSDVLAVLPGNSGLTAGVGSFSVTLKTVGSQTVTATDSVSGSITGTSGPISVSVAGGGATHFEVSGFPNPVTAGSAGTVTVNAVDQYGNVATGYVGTVAITSSDGKAVLPANTGLTNGVGFFTVTLETVGSQSITATDTVMSTITGFQTGIIVNAAPLDHLTISPIDASITAGNSQAYSVEAFDQYNNDLGSVTSSAIFTVNRVGISGNVVSETLTGSYNIVASEGGKSVSTTLTVNSGSLDHIVISPKTATISISSSQVYSSVGFDEFGNSLGSIAAVYSVSAGATVTGNLVFSTVAGSYTVTATFSGKTDTATLTVTAATGGATYFVVSAVPISIPAGSSVSVYVAAVDQYGNVVTGYSGTVHFSSSDVLAVLPGNSGLTAGVGSFSVTLKTVGSQTVTATDSVTSSITGTSNAVTVSVPAGSATHFAVSAPSSVAPGSAFNVNVTAVDQFGNRVTGYSGRVHFTSTSAGTLPGDSTLSDGTGVFSVTLTTSGSQTVTGTDTLTSSITGSATLTVTGYTVTFTENGLASGTAWNITFGGTVYSSAVSTITIVGVSAINYLWSTSSYIQLGQTRYVAGQISGFINVPSQLTQNIVYQTQYLVSYAASGNVLAVTVPSNEWVNSSLAATGVFPVQVINSQGNARCNYVSDNRTSITQPTTIMATYRTQYYLTVSSPYGTVSGSGWYDSGSIATVTINSGTVSGGSGVQNLFTAWSSDATGSALTSNSITMNGPKTATANWKTQYYLTVTSGYGTPTGQGWYDAGSIANIALSQTINSGTNTRQIFSTWAGSGTGAYTGSDTTQTITMYGPITETASWITQYLVTYTVTGNAITLTLPSNEWITSGTAAKGMFPPIISNQANNTQCIFISDNRPSSIIQPTTITASYQTQYKVTFSQTGIESDATGTIVTINSDTENYSQLSSTIWVNNLAKVNFTYEDIVASTTANKQYTLSSVNATSPLAIDAPKMVQGTYEPQYSTSLFTVAEFALIFFALLLLLLILLAWRRRRKQEQEENKSKTNNLYPM